MRVCVRAHVCMYDFFFIFNQNEREKGEKEWKQSNAKKRTFCEGAIYYIWSTEIPPSRDKISYKNSYSSA